MPVSTFWYQGGSAGGGSVAAISAGHAGHALQNYAPLCLPVSMCLCEGVGVSVDVGVVCVGVCGRGFGCVNAWMCGCVCAGHALKDHAPLCLPVRMCLCESVGVSVDVGVVCVGVGVCGRGYGCMWVRVCWPCTSRSRATLPSCEYVFV